MKGYAVQLYADSWRFGMFESWKSSSSIGRIPEEFNKRAEYLRKFLPEPG
jgi:hypothetical protein